MTSANADLEEVKRSMERSNDREMASMEAHWDKEMKKGRDIAEKHSTPAKKDKDYVKPFKNLSEKERAERFYMLLDENIKLKTHQAVLDGELVKTSTRLQRIKEMIARERQLNGGNFGIGFGRQIDEIIDANTELSLNNEKLRSIIKGLKDRMAEMIKNGYNRPGMSYSSKRLVSSGTAYKGGKRAPKSTKKGRPSSTFAKPRNVAEEIGDIHSIKDKDLAIQKMKENLNTQAITIQTLQNEVAKRRNKEEEYKQKLHDFQDMYDDKERALQRKETEESNRKTRDNKLIDELNRTKADNQTLKAQVLMLQSTQGTAEENRKYIHDLTMEKNDYEHKLTSLLTDPFFRREAGNEFNKKMHKLEEENEKMKNELDQLKAEKAKRDLEINKLQSDYDSMTDEQRHKKVHGGSYPFKFDGTAVDLNEMKKALLSMDPSVFRATMDQLTYDGDEPLWAKIDFLEQMGVGFAYDKKDPKSVERVMELMKQDKRELAAALEKAQQLLKLQYDIEKENKEYYKAETDELHAKIKELTLRLEESRKLAEQRLEEITIMKKTGYAPKGDKVGIEYDRMDADSEFSMATLETDLKHEENILDLALDKAEYYPNSLHQVVESDVISEKGFLTFFTVEFYDHDVKATDVTNGLEPGYSTLFSFKNKVDDYYIQFLQSNRVKLELFLNKSQKVKKIGFANITLRELIERDYDTLEGMKSPIITGIININSSANPALRIGSIKYKMRMRKSLNEALRWFREKHDLNTAQRSKKVTQQYLSTKIIAINIIQCYDLKSKYAKDPRDIRPFFFYSFYKFDEYYSKSAKGANPQFDDIKTFSTEIDDKFKNYSEEKTFEISVFDDGVHMGGLNVDDETIDDMIGVAHIPLFDVAKGRGIWDKFTLKDYNGNVNGMIEVKISVHNTLEDVNAPFLQQTQLSTDDWSKEFLFKICYRYVDKEHVNLNSLFAIFSKGEENISKHNFRDTIIPKKCGVSEAEIDMFIKDCEPFQKRGYMKKEEFNTIMKGPFKRAVHEDRIRRKELNKRRDSEDSDDFRRDTKANMEDNKKSARTEKQSAKEEIKRDVKRDTDVSKKTKKDDETRYATKPDPGLIDRVKKKIKDFMIKDGISLPLFYEYIDKDGDKRLDMNEFTSKITNINIDITKEESQALFRYCDSNDSGEITYNEFSTTLADINIDYILHKIKGITKTVGSTLTDQFKDYDAKDKGHWTRKEFDEFMDDFGGDITSDTRDILFRHMDKDGGKTVSLAEFTKAFNPD